MPPLFYAIGGKNFALFLATKMGVHGAEAPVLRERNPKGLQPRRSRGGSHLTTPSRHTCDPPRNGDHYPRTVRRYALRRSFMKFDDSGRVTDSIPPSIRCDPPLRTMDGLAMWRNKKGMGCRVLRCVSCVLSVRQGEASVLPHARPFTKLVPFPMPIAQPTRADAVAPTP
jgi:hypothetical protein